MVVEGQIQGAVALGIGSALLEEIVYDEAGQLQAGTYMDYLLPTATDVPTMTIDHLETLSPLNPLGMKGVGESGALPVPAVLASAIDDAVGPRGGRVTRMPLGPRASLELLPPRLDRLARAPPIAVPPGHHIRERHPTPGHILATDTRFAAALSGHSTVTGDMRASCHAETVKRHFAAWRPHTDRTCHACW